MYNIRVARLQLFWSFCLTYYDNIEPVLSVQAQTRKKCLDQWFSNGGPQHVSRVGHGRLCTLIMGLHAE